MVAQQDGSRTETAHSEQAQHAQGRAWWFACRTAWGVLVGSLVGLSSPLPPAALAQGAASEFRSAGSPPPANFETPQTRLRPIDAPSAVDRFRSAQPMQSANSSQASGATYPTHTAYPPGVVETASVRQTAWMQSAPGGSSVTTPAGPSGGFAPPPTGALPPPLTSSPSAGPINLPPDMTTGPLPRPGVNQAPEVPMTPQFGAPPTSISPSIPVTQNPASASDYASVPQPQLGHGYATVGNCRNVTGPSGYRSDRILTCAPGPGYVTTVANNVPQTTYVQPPAQIGPPVLAAPTPGFSTVYPGLPAQPLVSGQPVIPGAPKHRPLVSFGQDRNPVQVGQGIVGQPTAYVPGQPIRNFIRYLSP